METRVHHILIGSFVIICALAVVSFVLWLSKATMDRDHTHYDIIFQDEVSGLTPGSSVEYSGINVGNVVSMQLDPQDPRIVIVRIRVAADTPVKEDTGARLGLANITGSALIRLHGGSPESPPLEGREGEPAVIVADRSSLNQLLANSEDLISDVNDFVQNVNSLFSEENRFVISEILANVEGITGMLAGQQAQLENTLVNLNAMLSESQQTLHEFRRLASQGSHLLDIYGEDFMTSAELTMRSLAESSERIARLVEQNEAALNSGLQGLHELGPAASDLRRTLRAFERIARRFEEDPGSILLQREQVREFNP